MVSAFLLLSILSKVLVVKSSQSHWTSSYKQELLIAIVVLQIKATTCVYNTHHKDDSKIPLHIGGFFGIPDTEVYTSIPTIVQTAVDHVNNLTGILDGYELRLRSGPRVGVNPASALCLLHEFIYTSPDILMAWGPLFSKEAEVVNEVAPVYNIIQVTGANSPNLKNRVRFPLTIRMSLDEDLLNPARAAFVRHMGWKKVAIVYEDIEYFRENMESLAITLQKSGITVIAVEVVNNVDEPIVQIHNLMRHDARIIFAGFYVDSAVKFFCELVNKTNNFFGSRHVWILPGWFQDHWWRSAVPDVICDVHKLYEVLGGHISISWMNRVDNATKLNFGGVKPHPHHMPFINAILNDDSELKIRHHSEAYDSIILMALALNESLGTMYTSNVSANQIHATNETASLLWNNAINTDFIGLTGHLYINESGFRCQDDLIIYVYQNQGGRRVRVLEYINGTGEFEVIQNRSFQWQGPYTPVDGVTRELQHKVVSSKLRISLFTLAVLGLVLAVGFLFVNIKFRHKKVIKVTSPHLNNLIIGGCVCLYMGVFLIAVDTSELREKLFVTMCGGRMWFICVGISLAFGSLFMKTYRIRAIFVDAVTKLRKIKMSDSRLITYVLALVVLDTLVVWTWYILGDPNSVIKELQPENSTILVVDGREVLVVPIIRYCSADSEKVYVTCLYLMKGLLLAAGVFLAWETRSISIAELNDSRNIAMCVYVVALTCVFVVPISNLNGTNLELKVAVIGFCTIAANTTVLCLVFLPKIFQLCMTKESEFHISLMPKTTRGARVSPQDRISKLRLELHQKEALLRKLIGEYNGAEYYKQLCDQRM
ncbi:gamma-aminobutyric acid type B receptor subunit 2-like [Amphiura filiformis]|uniref:gamma-aminobutyric acid type B receptor subunit 2-like n=1 Tax=Amphiura filiformis TaxID=82378 RepID=UPI003B218E00